jgi:threonine/homoserine/homoserine lactone efflux protein
VLVKGFRFGMLLQLAVGPVALFIFQTALVSGFISAATGVIGAALVDAIFIVAAIIGIGAVLQKEKAAAVMKIFGALILITFGISTVLGVFGLAFIPGFNLAQGVETGSVFQRAVLITASNPLTIIFWAGVFSARLAEGDLKGSETYTFGCGAVLATLFFLTLIALVGTTTGRFLSDAVIQVLNAAVGVLLIYFGVRMFTVFTARKV